MMGKTAENLHDMYPDITREMADEYALLSQKKTAKANAQGKIQKMIVPMTVYPREAGQSPTGTSSRARTRPWKGSGT